MATNPNPNLNPHSHTIFGGGAGMVNSSAGGAGAGSYGSGYSTTTAEPIPPDWREQSFVLKDSVGQAIGIFKGPIDANVSTHFTLYQPDQPECPTIPLTQTLLDPMDYDTQVAFETLPILEVWHYVSQGVLLKFPD